ncbi:hypothetical protein MMC12_002272 [Toensbergia leucococca]|nr:hypothetical protein [Toensbergia leucococca]
MPSVKSSLLLLFLFCALSLASPIPWKPIPLYLIPLPKMDCPTFMDLHQNYKVRPFPAVNGSYPIGRPHMEPPLYGCDPYLKKWEAWYGAQNKTNTMSDHSNSVKGRALLLPMKDKISNQSREEDKAVRYRSDKNTSAPWTPAWMRGPVVTFDSHHPKPTMTIEFSDPRPAYPVPTEPSA